MDIYEKLLSMVIPSGLLPPGVANMMAEATRAAVTVEQAEFMLENAERFEERFGEGEYAAVTTRMMTAAMAPLTGAFGVFVADPGRGLEGAADSDLIREARVLPDDAFGGNAVVKVRYGDGEWVLLCRLVIGERHRLSDALGGRRLERTLVGLDTEGARALFAKEDIAYLGLEVSP